MFAPTMSLQCRSCTDSCDAHSPRHRRRSHSASHVRAVINEPSAAAHPASPSSSSSKSHVFHGLRLQSIDVADSEYNSGAKLLEVVSAESDQSFAMSEMSAEALEQAELNELARVHFGAASYAALNAQQREHLHIIRHRSTAAEQALPECKCTGCSSTLHNLFATTGRLLSDEMLASLRTFQMSPLHSVLLIIRCLCRRFSFIMNWFFH